MHVTRRDFARSMIGAAAGLLGMPVDTGNLTIGLFRPALNDSFVKGVMMGVEEAQRTGRLFQKTLSIRELTAVPATGVHAIVTCSDDSTIARLAAACGQHAITLFNCGSRSDALRRRLCRQTTFHVEASTAMYADAANASPRAGRIVLWDARLERYGAAQLNDRYRAFAGRPMDESAWAGWFAVKAAWESFLRGADVSTMQFDGHKGAPLSFRTWDHQLRQPLYALGERIIDVPDIGRSSLPVKELLDTIGDRQGAQRCG
jgi:hypothetical protein